MIGSFGSCVSQPIGSSGAGPTMEPFLYVFSLRCRTHDADSELPRMYPPVLFRIDRTVEVQHAGIGLVVHWRVRDFDVVWRMHLLGKRPGHVRAVTSLATNGRNDQNSPQRRTRPASRRCQWRLTPTSRRRRSCSCCQTRLLRRFPRSPSMRHDRTRATARRSRLRRTTATRPMSATLSPSCLASDVRGHSWISMQGSVSGR